MTLRYGYMRCLRPDHTDVYDEHVHKDDYEALERSNADLRDELLAALRKLEERTPARNEGLEVMTECKEVLDTFCVSGFIEGSEADQRWQKRRDALLERIGRALSRPLAQREEGKNEGHGHVYPRPDGMKARCGGPTCCKECAADLARKSQEAHIPVKQWRDRQAPASPASAGMPEDVAIAIARAVQRIGAGGTEEEIAAIILPLLRTAAPGMVMEGCTEVDIAVLRKANVNLATENERLREGLRFYAHGQHWINELQDDQWDTCSGEPQNWHWRENAEDSAEGIEDGGVARIYLSGEKADWEGEPPPEHPCEPGMKEILAAAPLQSSGTGKEG